MSRGVQIALTLILFTAVVAVWGRASPAHAQEPTAAVILASPEGSEGRVYLRGLKDGVEWYLSSRSTTKGEPLYCPPPSLGITSEQYRRILADQVSREPQDGTRPAGLVLLKGLRQTFPCAAR
jgi:hypothetical protein